MKSDEERPRLRDPSRARAAAGPDPSWPDAVNVNITLNFSTLHRRRAPRRPPHLPSTASSTEHQREHGVLHDVVEELLAEPRQDRPLRGHHVVPSLVVARPHVVLDHVVDGEAAPCGGSSTAAARAPPPPSPGRGGEGRRRARGTPASPREPRRTRADRGTAFERRRPRPRRGRRRRGRGDRRRRRLRRIDPLQRRDVRAASLNHQSRNRLHPRRRRESHEVVDGGW